MVLDHLNSSQVRKSQLGIEIRIDLYDTYSDKGVPVEHYEIVGVCVIDTLMELVYSNTARSNPITWIFTQ